MTKEKTYKFKAPEISSVEEMDMGKTYSYANYYAWKIKERVEIIKGKIFLMSAPNLFHQQVSSMLQGNIWNFLKGKKCQIFSAPFDVRLPKDSKADEDIFDIVQPDLCVVCDPKKLDRRGCIGAPDLIVEILSSSSSRRDLKDKYDLYQSHKVGEYWVIHPEEHTVLIYTLDKKGKYQPSRLLTKGDTARSNILKGLEVDLEEVFDY